ncbi:hypothetical protein FQN54_002818 [Arachnomyces sp. PD_36]|nr:hypothetical protein FQN54_002818 [Arachnomyces sp. PD_36]
MSAPHQGRQSPSPSRQTGNQERDPMASGKVSSDTARGAEQPANHDYAENVVSQDPKGESERTKEFKLESNPVHPLEHEAEVKAAKWMPLDI